MWKVDDDSLLDCYEEPKENRGVFFKAHNHTFGFVVMAVTLLALSTLSLLGSAIFGWGYFAILGQVLFVIFAFASISVLLIATIAQDIPFQ